MRSHGKKYAAARAQVAPDRQVAMGNVVFLGPVAGNRQMQAMSADRPFVLEPEGIRNMSPKPGEPELFADKLPRDPQPTHRWAAAPFRRRIQSSRQRWSESAPCRACP